MLVFYGTIVHSLSPSQLDVLQDAALFVNKETGIITALETDLKSEEALQAAIKRQCGDGDLKITRLDKNSFIIPGFIDTHIHAPQYVFTGTGYDLPLLEWLQKYTFPREREFENEEYAKTTYPKVVARSLRCGTTTACYYATIHLPATKLLTDIIEVAGQRAFIGKVNMDRNSPDWYIETSEESLARTRNFVEFVAKKGNDLLQPVITPRFTPSCTRELMTALGQLAKEHDLLIQTHISENLGEIEWVKDLHPECTGYADVYEKYGLLTSNCVMAHCIYLSEEERALFKRLKVGISHCPNSNFALQSGILNMRRHFDEGHLKIGLGSDVAGGYSPSLLDSMRQAIIASKVIYMQSKETSGGDDKKVYAPLSFKEAIYLATLGGAKVLNLDGKVGNFVLGKEFDALVVNLKATPGSNSNSSLQQITGESTVDIFQHETVSDLIEKFVYLGDDRNIVEIYVKGKKVFYK